MLLRRLLAPLSIAFLLAAGSPLLAQTPSGEETIDRLVARLRALRAEIDDLLGALDPATRAEVERRLAQPGDPPAAPAARPAVDPPPAAPTGPSGAPSTDPPAARPREPVPQPPPSPQAPAGDVCRPLAPFDSDGDGQVTGADRYWRHLYLWEDTNGDGSVAENETLSLFELGIRGVAIELDRYTTDSDFIGDVSLGETALFHLVTRRRDASRLPLVIDVDGVLRGEGPRLVDAEEKALAGLQPLRRGGALIGEGGERWGFPCPP